MRALDPIGPLSTLTKDQLTVLDLLQPGEKGVSYSVRDDRECESGAEEAGSTRKQHMMIDGWEEQDCEAFASSLPDGSSCSGSKEASGSWRRQSSFLRLRQAPKATIFAENNSSWKSGLTVIDFYKLECSQSLHLKSAGRCDFPNQSLFGLLDPSVEDFFLPASTCCSWTGTSVWVTRGCLQVKSNWQVRPSLSPPQQACVESRCQSSLWSYNVVSHNFNLFAFS